jgi:predicted short-subunit dehydrogenase-like oxidoreductase (DUF2520 family)
MQRDRAWGQGSRILQCEVVRFSPSNCATHAPQKVKTLNLIGAGKLGRTLARLWTGGGTFLVQDVACRSAGSAERAVAFIGAGRPCDDMAELRLADVFLIAVPDDALIACARQLADSGLLTPDSVVFHCSGSHCANAMAAVVLTGAAVASIHPVRSFAQPEEVLGSFAGTYCGTEGDGAALSVLNPAFESIGAVLVPIEARHKLLYHAAAVFASNYLVTVIDVALKAYGAAGIPREVALPMLAPLARNALENVFADRSDARLSAGPEAALSGPIARGDMALVARQYRALREWDTETATLYRQLARRTLRLARRRNGS